MNRIGPLIPNLKEQNIITANNLLIFKCPIDQTLAVNIQVKLTIAVAFHYFYQEFVHFQLELN